MRTYLIILSFLLSVSLYAQTTIKSTPISTDELLKWPFYGIGFTANSFGQLLISESQDSKGVMIVSPFSYGENTVLKYKLLVLTPATVMVNILCFSDKGDSQESTIPKDFDGAMGPITNGDNYFFAFKNDPHNTKPFIRKNPDNQIIAASVVPDEIIAGKYFDVEVGQCAHKLWLKIGGETILETSDKDYLKSGRISIRLRGIEGYPAGALIKNLVIETK